MLDSDWLTTLVTWYSILIGCWEPRVLDSDWIWWNRVASVQCLKICSRKPSQGIKIVIACIKIWSQWIKVCNACIEIWIRVFSGLCDNFWYWEIFRKKFDFSHHPPGRIITTPEDKYYACGKKNTCADRDLDVKRMCNSLKNLNKTFKNGQQHNKTAHSQTKVEKLHVLTYKREYINIVNSCNLFLSKLEEMKSCIIRIRASYT